MPVMLMMAQSESAAELVLAVDAGGTKTAACIAHSDAAGDIQILGRGESAGGNPLSVGFDAATRAIETAVSTARADAKLTQAAARAVLSIAGAANPEIAAQVVRWAQGAKLAERIAVVSDVLPILAAGTDDYWGIAVIAGTGSVAFGRAADGRTVRCGGWGYLIGDDGSGYAIGRAALRQTLSELESPSVRGAAIAAEVLKETNCTTAAQLTKSIYSHSTPRAFIASLAPVVVKLADAEDAAAHAILASSAIDLATLVARTADSLGIIETTFSLAVAGGVLAGSEHLRGEVVAQLAIQQIAAKMRVVTNPLAGCLRLTTPECPAGLVVWQDLHAD